MNIGELDLLQKSNVYKAIPTAMVIINDSGIVADINNSALEILGYSHDEILGRECNLFCLDPCAGNCVLFNGKFVENNQNREGIFLRKDGEIRIISKEIGCWEDDSGKKGLVEVFRDITEQKRLESAESNPEQQLLQVLQSLPVIAFILDDQSRLTYCNDFFLKLIGFNRSEMINKSFNKYFRFNNEGDVWPILSNVQPSKLCPETFHEQVSVTTVSGESLILNLNITASYDDNGNFQRLICIGENITERQRIETELMKREARISKELQLASAVQSSFFPVHLPEIPGATLAATVVPANEVGGDYCDLFITKDDKLGIAIGDVMGKGVPAAIFAAMIYAFVRNNAMDGMQPRLVMNRVNTSLYPQLDFNDEFITLFFSTFDPKTRELTYTNAGHNPPIIFRYNTGSCEKLPVRDFFVGGKQDAQFKESKVMLFSGDIVLFYTDGLKEGKNPDGEQFGLERVIRILIENSMADPASLQEIISMEFSDFLSGMCPSDDVTMIVLKLD